MKKKYRIKRNSEIDAIFRKKIYKSDSCFAVYQADDLEALNFRFALSIGKKYGNAVSRNLIKRRIRMIVAENKNQFIINKLFVIVIKPQARDLSFEEIKTKLVALFKKSNIMESKNE
jgi:ribonuclease P protein component